MITGVIQLDFAVAGIDRQPLLIAEKRVARLVLTAGGVRMFAKFSWPPALWRFHGRHWFHFRHGFHTFQSEPSLSEKFPAFGSPVNASSRTLRIKGKGSVFQDVPVPGRLSQALLEWKTIQEGFKGRRIMAPDGIAFAGSQFVFAGYSGAPFSNRTFNLRLRSACRALGVGEITAHGLRHSAATILLNQVGKDLREIQELLRHKNIRRTVRYTHVGYEQTRQTAEALSQALE